MRLKLLTLPNLVTLVRVAVLPFVWQAMKTGDRTTLAALVVVLCLSDFLDGFLARALGQVSDSGKLLDPLADKIDVLVLSVALYLYTPFPLWALVMLFTKDVLIALGGGFIARRKRIPITPNFWGKAAVTAEMAAFIAFAFGLGFLQTDTLVVMTLFVAVSFLLYARIFVQVMGGRKSVDEIVRGYTAYGLSRSARGRQRVMNIFIYLLCALILARLVWLLATHI